jgi:flavin reductase (DIM6/NTAB) family NADH-FMN oxidoreductase RutF
VPILDDCPSWFVGRVVWRADAGDHDAFLLEPVAAEAEPDEREFTFHRAKRIDAGHEA